MSTEEPTGTPSRDPAVPSPTERAEPAEVLDAEIVGDADGTPHSGYDERGVPSFDFVRERIEQRTATALGAQELDAESPAGRTLEQQQADREEAGRDRLEAIRRQMRGED
jgi:hypothetical protein